MKDVIEWLIGNDTGLSSTAIVAHMMLGKSDGNYPYDPADLGRCLRLLERFPQWKKRLPEMGRYGKVWRRYVKHWAALETSMRDEVGIDWSKAHAAPQTYRLMQKIAARQRP